MLMGEVENIERQLLTSRKLGFILTNHVRILMRTACWYAGEAMLRSDAAHAELGTDGEMS